MRRNIIEPSWLPGAAQQPTAEDAWGGNGGAAHGRVRVALELPVTRPWPPLPPAARPGQRAWQCPLWRFLLSAREYPGIKRNRGTVLKEQVKRKFKAPLLIITV